jgi:hypothetical protein
MKSVGSTIRGEQVCAIPVNLHDAATCQTPKQTRSPKVLKGIFETAAEQSVSIPAKFGCTLRPWAGDKSLAVVHENTPPPNRNTR